MASGPRFYMPKAYAFDEVGVTVPGALLNFYLTGSDTPTPTFANATLTVANTNPVEADAAGLFPDIFLNPLVIYKVVLTGPDDGITPPHEYWTADPVNQAWATDSDTYFDLPCEYLGGTPPAMGATIFMYVAVRPQRFFGDFDGRGDGYEQAQGACLVAPTDALAVITIYRNNDTGTPLGTITVQVGTGAFTFTTTAGDNVDLDIGEFLTGVLTTATDSTLADLSFTLTGVNI